MPDDQPYLAAMASPALITADELLRLSIPDKRVELVRGTLVVREPPGFRHGRVAMDLAARLADHVRTQGLGQVCAAETGFRLSTAPDTVRAPDIAFVSRARLPDPELVGYAPLAPDLVVEVLSPTDRPGEVLAKVADWLNAGSRLVWVVDPERRLARVYRQDGSEARLNTEDDLSGEDVVPGFSVRLADIL
ncbi:MAG: Uma2 family endonuclease [Candidatus Rokuibacteriota bacterium]